MKTKMLICTGMFAAVAAFAAQPVETKITHEGVWKNAEGVYTQNYPGHDYDSLLFRFPAESDGFYKLSGKADPAALRAWFAGERRVPCLPEPRTEEYAEVPQSESGTFGGSRSEKESDPGRRI